MRSRLASTTQFPFRRDNRRRDGFWDAPDATEDNIKDTSVDPYDPVWPRWKQAPPHHGEGEFISDEPFFDIDEIAQMAKLYPPGTPLVDRNIDGNPASRQRVRDIPTGNLWRRRLLVQHENSPQTDAASQVPDTNLVLIGQTPAGAPAPPTVPSFGGFIPGRALPGNAPSAIEPLNPGMRERKRKKRSLQVKGAAFRLHPTPTRIPKRRGTST